MKRSLLMGAGIVLLTVTIASASFGQEQEFPPIDATEQRLIAEQILAEMGFENTPIGSSSGQPASSGQPGQGSSGAPAPQTSQPTRALPSLPSLGSLSWFLLAILLGTVFLVVWKLVGRRVRGVEDRTRPEPSPSSPDRPHAKSLEASAEEAARNGDYEQAVRLRFRAGLVRLEKRGVLEYQETLTTGDVANLLANEDFDLIALSFDEIAYGRRPADADDYALSNRQWPRVIERAQP